MLSFIVSRLISQTILSLILSTIVGSAIGALVGAVRRRLQDTIYVSIVGSFLGCLLACIVPPVYYPGSLESWGAAGGLGSLSVLVSLFFIALGGLIGGLVASTFGFKPFLKMKAKWAALVLIGVYSLMVVSLYRGHLQYCSPSISYC